MSILSRIYDLRQEYENKHDSEPDVLFINFSTWEEVLRHPNSVNGVPEKIAGCEVYPANNMQEDILFCDHHDMAKALNEYDGTDYPVIIKKLTVVNRPEAQGARRITNDRSFLNFQIPSEAIKVYQRSQLNKNLKF
ncbi:hypothetical protein [uncultured Acinetobacter sp.]|uniref:hypothetical protein n=1 Tax=uncultured Acinetobacter sp. TaxID=165433 RepID=UPI00258C8B93|nr:hypothetical protein [uncultured Acinetobacter sp.]